MFVFSPYIFTPYIHDILISYLSSKLLLIFFGPMVNSASPSRCDANMHSQHLSVKTKSSGIMSHLSYVRNVCMYVCLCMYVCVCMYMYVHLHAYEWK